MAEQNRVKTCRVLDRHNDRCTAEAVNPEHELPICIRHLGLALELVRDVDLSKLDADQVA